MVFPTPRRCWIRLGFWLVASHYSTAPVRATAAAATATPSSSFHRDVVRPAHQHRATLNDPDVNAALRLKAIPLAQYEALKSFVDGDGNRVRLGDRNAPRGGDGGGHFRRLAGGDDFYGDDYTDRYSFSGYSMKYAKCQPVQYFSEDAIAAGEHSPMITEDIVILRLCPQKSCAESAQYGCHYNYAEYAIALSDYLTVMLKYSAKRQTLLCDYCTACGVVDQGGNNNAADDAENGGGGGGGRFLEEAVQNEDAGDDQPAQNDNPEDRNYDCTNVATICADFDSQCASYNNNGDDNSGDGYLTYDQYLNYLQCAEVKYNDYSYFVRPRCDGYQGTIKMAVFYDTYCVQYAGKDVGVKDLGMGFRENIFTSFYNGTCVECSVASEAPFYDTNTALCNKIHGASAKCTADLLYNLFDGEETDATECSYIESIRFGTYDEEGKLSSATYGVNWSGAEISESQRVLLSFSIALCVALVVYSCYLHHAMTNLLIKSLSHRELLPPSRHYQARRFQQQQQNGAKQQPSSSSVNRGGNQHNDLTDSDGSDDWEKPTIV